MALSKQEFQKLQGLLKATPVDEPIESSGGFTSSMQSSFAQRDKNVQNIARKTQTGQQNLGSGLLQSTGQVAGLAGDVATNALSSITPQAVKDVASGFASSIAGTDSARKAVESYEKLKKSNPEAVANLEAVFNIATLIPALKGGQIAGQGAKTAVKGVVSTGVDTAKGAKNIVGAGASKIADVISPIDEGTQTVLNPTRLIPKENLKNIPTSKIVAQAEDKTQKFDRYMKTAQQSVDDYSKPTPLVSAGDKAGEALNVLTNKLTKQGTLKKDALGDVGNKKVSNIGTFRAKLRDDLRDKVGVNIVVNTKNGKKVLDVETAQGRASKIAFDPADNKLIKDTYKTLSSLGKTPTVQQIDDTIDALQDMLYKRRTLTAVPVNGQVEGVIKSITGQLNKAVKKVAGEKYTKANSKYSYFVDVRDKLNKALGEEGVRGATLMKQLFSPSGEAPRRLFEDIKKLTGIDLVEEATLAKFAMENVGDARQASLLEEAIRSGSITPKSFVATAAKRLLTKGTKPVDRARKIISGGSQSTK